jgi:hypothetical protein
MVDDIGIADALELALFSRSSYVIAWRTVLRFFVNFCHWKAPPRGVMITQQLSGNFPLKIWPGTNPRRNRLVRLQKSSLGKSIRFFGYDLPTHADECERNASADKVDDKITYPTVSGRQWHLQQFNHTAKEKGQKHQPAKR